MQKLITLLCLFAGSFAAHRTFAASSIEEFRIKEFSGRGVTEILAMSCPDKSWREFASFARRTGYADYNRAVDFKVKMDWKKNLVKIEGQDAEVNFTGGKMRARFAGRSFEAGDGCDLLLKMLNGRQKYSLENLFWPAAHADELPNDGPGRDRLNFTGGVLASIAVLGLGYSGGLTAFITTPAGIYLGYKAGNSLARAHMKEALAAVLQDGIKVTCDAQQMSLVSGIRTVIVNKNPPSVTYQEYGKTIYNNEATVSATKTREYLLAQAQACPAPNSPGELNRTLEDKRIQTLARVDQVIGPSKPAVLIKESEAAH